MTPEYAMQSILSWDEVTSTKIVELCTENNVPLLSLAEAAVYFGHDSICQLVEDSLTEAQKAVLSLVKLRKNTGAVSIDKVNDALSVCQNKETRDLVLEGRVRMERGLVYYTLGEKEKADEDLTWAETRLKSVAKASKDHDLSLLNKAAFHQAVGEDLMALQVYGDISVNSGHADETIAISRLHASRINARIDRKFDAIRLAFNSHKHAILADMAELALESGTAFVDLALPYSDESADRIVNQIARAKPRDIGDEVIEPKINPADINGVFDWCYNNLKEGYGGETRPDLQAVYALSHKLGKQEIFDDMLANPNEIEDGLLIALIKSTVEDKDGVWAKRIAQITAKSFEFMNNS